MLYRFRQWVYSCFDNTCGKKCCGNSKFVKFVVILLPPTTKPPRAAPTALSKLRFSQTKPAAAGPLALIHGPPCPTMPLASPPCPATQGFRRRAGLWYAGPMMMLPIKCPRSQVFPLRHGPTITNMTRVGTPGTLKDPREQNLYVRCLVEHAAKVLAEPLGAGGRWCRLGQQSRREHRLLNGRADVRSRGLIDVV